MKVYNKMDEDNDIVTKGFLKKELQNMMGASASSKHVLTVANDKIKVNGNNNSQYRYFSLNGVTQWGNIHLDFIPSEDINLATILRLEASGITARPLDLLEVQCIGSLGAVSTVFLKTNGEIVGQRLKANNRYIVDLYGYFVG